LKTVSAQNQTSLQSTDLVMRQHRLDDIDLRRFPVVVPPISRASRSMRLPALLPAANYD
jgi:hypothetical protein